MHNIQILDSDIARFNALEWTTRNRMLPFGDKKIAFSISRPPYMYPFLKDIYYSRGVGGPKIIVLIKPRQIGATEFALNSAFYSMDAFSMNCIYCLPGQKELRSFAGARVNEIIRSSPNIKAMFSDIDNLDLKVGRSSSLYFRGLNSAAGLEEVPADYVIIDEIDQADQANAAMIMEALGGSFYKWRLYLSHPTYPGKGIDLLYSESSMNEWVFPCPHCGKIQAPTWDNNVDIENCRLYCRFCGETVTKEDMWKGHYLAKDHKNPIAGFHFNQLLSPTVDLSEQIAKYKAAEGIPFRMRIFYNTILALPYAESSRQLRESDVRELMKGPAMPFISDESVIGMDVGNGLHLWIQRGNELLTIAQLTDWDELDIYIKRYKPTAVVIDAGPEGHKARETCVELRKRGIDSWLCMRSDGMKGTRSIDDETMTIKVNKTEQFDEFYSRIVEMILPIDLPQEGIDHIIAPVRTMKTKPDGSKEGMWVKGISHYADAGSYAMEAAKQVELKRPQVINVHIPNISGNSRWKGKFDG